MRTVDRSQTSVLPVPNASNWCLSKSSSVAIMKLTNHQGVWGNRETILVYDQVCLVFQQFPCVFPIQIVII